MSQIHKATPVSWTTVLRSIFLKSVTLNICTTSENFCVTTDVSACDLQVLRYTGSREKRRRKMWKRVMVLRYLRTIKVNTAKPGVNGRWLEPWLCFVCEFYSLTKTPTGIYSIRSSNFIKEMELIVSVHFLGK